MSEVLKKCNEETEWKVICLFDNEFEITYPVARGLALYKAKKRKPKYSLLIILCHICDKDDPEMNSSVSEENQTNFLKATQNIEGVKGCYFSHVTGEDSDYEDESEKLVELVVAEAREAIGKDIDRSDILFLLDLDLLLNDQRRFERKEKCLANAMYMLLENGRLKLYTSYNDEKKVFLGWRKTLKEVYKKNVKGIEVYSRIDLMPEAFNLNTGKEIFDELERD